MSTTESESRGSRSRLAHHRRGVRLLSRIRPSLRSRYQTTAWRGEPSSSMVATDATWRPPRKSAWTSESSAADVGMRGMVARAGGVGRSQPRAGVRGRRWAASGSLIGGSVFCGQPLQDWAQSVPPLDDPEVPLAPQPATAVTRPRASPAARITAPAAPRARDRRGASARGRRLVGGHGSGLDRAGEVAVDEAAADGVRDEQDDADDDRDRGQDAGRGPVAEAQVHRVGLLGVFAVGSECALRGRPRRTRGVHRVLAWSWAADRTRGDSRAGDFGVGRARGSATPSRSPDAPTPAGRSGTRPCRCRDRRDGRRVGEHHCRGVCSAAACARGVPQAWTDSPGRSVVRGAAPRAGSCGGPPPAPPSASRWRPSRSPGAAGSTSAPLPYPGTHDGNVLLGAAVAGRP